MSQHSSKENPYRAVTEFEDKLQKMNTKILELKKKYQKKKRCGRESAQLREHYLLLKREVECTENDIMFVRSLTEGSGPAELHDTLALRIIKKLLPRKGNGRNSMSEEFRAVIVRHITAYFEEKVNRLERLGKSLRKIRKNCHLLSGDSNTSKTGESDITIKSKNKTVSFMSIGGWRESSETQNIEPQDLDKSNSQFTFGLINNQKYACEEKCIQTEEKPAFRGRENSAQTETSDQTWPVMMEIYEALRRISEEYVCCERLSSVGEEDLVHKTVSTESYTPPKFSMSMSPNDGSGYTRDVFQMANLSHASPFCKDYSISRKRNVRHLFHDTSHYCLPYVYHVTECQGLSLGDDSATYAEEKLESNSTISVQVQLTPMDEAKEKLQIDYCRNSRSSGRITLSQFGDEHTRAEILGRIVTYLLALPRNTSPG